MAAGEKIPHKSRLKQLTLTPFCGEKSVLRQLMRSDTYNSIRIISLRKSIYMREPSLEATYSPKVVGLGCNNLNFLCPFRIRKKVKKELCLYNADGSLEP